MKQLTGSKLRKEYNKAVYCHPVYLTSVQSTSCEMPDWMKHKLDSILPGEVSTTSEMQMTPPLCQKVKRNYRASWWKWKRRVKKADLKLNIQKMKIMASGPITSWETVESDIFYFLGLQNHYGQWLQPRNSKMFAPWKESYDKPRQYIIKQRHYFANKRST